MKEIEQFVSLYPQLFHMAEKGSWPDIQRHGLLSTTALLDLFDITGQSRFKIESAWRPSSVTIEHPVHGAAVIRDQNPMPPASLERVLLDVTLREWYELLNRKTFLWVDEERLNKMLNARLYKDKKHDVITVDTRALVDRHSDVITLSPINSGFSLFGRGMRGTNTFQRMEEYLLAARQRGVVELAVDCHVPNIEGLATSVTTRKGTNTLETIWER